MKTARIVILVALVAAFGFNSSHAQTPSSGTVTTTKAPGMPDHETLAYYAEGCSGTHADAVFEAFVDVRAHRGETLHFTPTGADVVAAVAPSWVLTFGTSCEVRTVGSSASTSAPTTLVVPSDALYVSLMFFTTGVVNAHYEIEFV